MYITFYIINPNLHFKPYILKYYMTNNFKIKGIRKNEYCKYLYTSEMRKCVSQLRINITVFLLVHFSPELVKVNSFVTSVYKQ
jgi:hypothetical protein